MRHPLENGLDKAPEIVLERGQGNDLGEIIELAVPLDERQKRFLFDEVHLVDQEEYRRLDFERVSMMNLSPPPGCSVASTSIRITSTSL